MSPNVHGRSIALMKFLSAVAKRLGVASHVYIVGGAPRNFALGVAIKDLDVVLDTIALDGRNSEWFAKEVQKSIPTKASLVTNQYGVAILTVSGPWTLTDKGADYEMHGEVIEIANARSESYGGSSGKSYKPHLVEPATIDRDVVRRDFSVNTLLWRLEDLGDGPEGAPILDLTGKGRKHLEDRELHTPLDPDKTFSDDPTRMLRAIRFLAKYNLRISPDLAQSIRRNAPKLAGMPWDAVRKILTDDILDAPNPRRSIVLLQELGLADVLRDMLMKEPGFASALSRSLSDAETMLLFDLTDLGWAIRTPLWFLDKNGQERVREILLSSDDQTGQAFVAALKKPPIDQMPLFTKYEIPAKDRQRVTSLARSFLLPDPTLAQNPARLTALVEDVLGRMYPAGSLPGRVLARFTLREP